MFSAVATVRLCDVAVAVTDIAVVAAVVSGTLVYALAKDGFVPFSRTVAFIADKIHEHAKTINGNDVLAKDMVTRLDDIKQQVIYPQC